MKFIRNSTKTKNALVAAFIVVTLFMPACATTQQEIGVVAPTPLVATHTFVRPLFANPDHTVKDPDNPVQLIRQGLVLSEKGRHRQAADFFVLAANRPAPDSELRIMALFAAANEYLYNGDGGRFQATMQLVSEHLDTYKRATLSEEEEVLLSLYDLSLQKPYDPNSHHKTVKNLFKDN